MENRVTHGGGSGSARVVDHITFERSFTTVHGITSDFTPKALLSEIQVRRHLDSTM